MTVLSLLGLDSPAAFADWYRIGADYVLAVARGMALDVGDFPARAEEATAAMRAGRTDLRPELARSVAADLLADAAFPEPFCEWMPLWYELGLLPFNRYADRQLRAVAGAYARGLDGVQAPRFARPSDVYVRGRPATAWLPASGRSGFRARFLAADALLHLEWFVHVARESGIAVPEALVARTRRESAAYYTGQRESLSAEVRRFQHHLFADDAWVRRIDEAYGLDSALLGVWARILREERERLA